MKIVANLLVSLVAIQHIGFMVLEMFFWTKPLGLKVFKTNLEFAQQSQTLAANQGLYNGFLAAGLIWALSVQEQAMSTSLKLFFLACVLVAGLYGWFTVGRTILFVQAVPAALALIIVFLSASK